jgi:D-alanyl-D-alanine carboxypeptidase/D-alanyl-D-alanine-endopeptidase (penicillin-binding protein 4)
MRRFYSTITFTLLLLQVAVAAAQTPQKPEKKDLARKIQGIIRQPGFSRAHWGIDVVDIENGKAIYALNPDHLFLPASNAKLLSTSAALGLVGPEYRFHTTVETTGKIDANGRLLGDLVIVGRGDPNISGRVLPYQLKTERVSPHTQVLEQLADQVVQKGVKIIDGDLIGDDSYYAPERYGEGWAHDYLQWIDGAPVSALTFNDNVLFVKIQPGEKAGDKALVTVDPQTNYYDLDNRILTTAAGIARKIGLHRDSGSYKVVLWGGLPVDDPGMNEALAIEDPAEFTAQLFRSLLEARGITITGKTRPKHGEVAQFFDQAQPSTAVLAAPVGTSAQVLAEHVSLALIEDVRVTNKTSQNLHAELALRLIGRQKGIGGSFEGGAATLKQFLLQAGLKTNEFFVLDGSGLSRRDLITPGAMVQLLLYVSRQPWGAAFEETLPVAGVDGSLAERFVNTPAGGLVHAKTGTLSHVNALSGYGQTSTGKRFVFSIFCNNHDLPSAKVVAAIDSIVVLLVSGGVSSAKVPDSAR